MSEPDTAADEPRPTGVIVAVGASADRAQPFATTLAERLSLPVSSVHVDTSTSPVATEDELAGAIAMRVAVDQVLVVESNNADPWRSRHSIAEHLVDAFAGTTIGLGPKARSDVSGGPIVVALDGSAAAESALPFASWLASRLECGLLLVRIVPDHLHGDERVERADAGNYLDTLSSAIAGNVTIDVGVSNDPVQAIVTMAAAADATLVALASRGDRQHARTSMSRTAAGVIGRAGCPVVVVAAATD